MAKPEKTLRKVSVGLWVSDTQSAEDFSHPYVLLMDCSGKGVKSPRRVSCLPTGSTSHSWTVSDLNKIVARVKAHKGPVVFHCHRGVSRSTCAAAAVLLDRGEALTVEEALAKTSHKVHTPATQSVSGLQKWWAARQQTALF